MQNKLAFFKYHSSTSMIVTCFIFNFFFKLINLTSEPIWYDECFSIFYSQQSIGDILQVSTWEPPPPLFNLILHFWIKLFGVNEFAVRLFPVLISSLAGAVLYLFLKKFTTNRIALTASVLYLFSDISFYYAQEVRCYSFVLLISIVSLWLFIELLTKPNYILSLALGFSYYILMMTHYLTCFILLFQGIVFLLFINKIFFKHYLMSVVSFLILFTHWLPRFLEVARGDGGNNHWLQSPTSKQLIDFLLTINNNPSQLIILSVLACIGIISIYLKKSYPSSNKALQAIFIYSIFISIGTILLSFFISSFMPIFLDRYLLYTLIGFIVFFSICISYLPTKDVYYYALILVVGIYSFSQVKLNVPTRKMNYRSAVAYTKQHQDSNTSVFIQSIDVTSLFTYYYDKTIFKDYVNIKPNLAKKRVYTGNDSIQLNSVMDTSYSKIIHVETYSNYSDPNQTVIAWFRNHGYKKIKEQDAYIGVKITIYQKAF